MSIIERYIAKEIFFSWITVLFVLIIIVLSTEVVHLLRWVSEGAIPLSAFFSFLINSLFEFSIVLVPLSLLMGILLGMGRLYKDSEMTAIMSFGIGPVQWYRPLMSVVVPVILLVFVLTLFVKPIIESQRNVLKAEMRSKPEIDSLLVGQFNRSGKSNTVLFLESEDDASDYINNVFLNQRRESQNHVDVAANTEMLTVDNGHRYMVMRDGIHYVGNAGESQFKIIEYKDYGVHVSSTQAKTYVTEKSKTVKQLWDSPKLADKAELQWRIAIPIATLIVACIALPLSKTDPRSGRYSKLAIALLIYLIYSNILGVAKTWILQEKIPVWIGTWWVHLIGLLLLFILLKANGYLVRVKVNNNGH